MNSEKVAPPSADRPVITAFGWSMPLWLLDYGPVAAIVVWGLLAIVVREHYVRIGVLLSGLLVVAIALALRHRAPLTVLAVVLVVSLSIGYGPVVTLPVLLAVFTVAEYTSRARVIAAALLAALVMILTPPIHGAHLGATAVLSRLVVVALPVALGLWLRTRADYVSGLRDRAGRLEREQELLAREAVGEERVRIARELHDVVAHNVSLMVVQAQALAATGAEEPERQAALDRVAGLGRDALSEMHRMLGVLRLQNGGAPEREPQPGVRDLEGLIARTRESGLDAELIVEGVPCELPPTVDLSAYRIVQEALTNVVRHANAGHALVRLAFAHDHVEVTVTDDGPGSGDAAVNGSAATGHGLVGMRERVALFGGALEAGRRVDGNGYRVHALLPVA